MARPTAPLWLTAALALAVVVLGGLVVSQRAQLTESSNSLSLGEMVREARSTAVAGMGGADRSPLTGERVFLSEEEETGDVTREERIEAQLDQSMARILSHYQPIFKELEVSEEEGRVLVERLVAMEEVRADAVEQLRELESERKRYDEVAEDLLGEERYAKYLQRDQGYAAGQVVEALAGAVPELTKEDQTRLQEELRSIGGGADFRGSFGPYGDVPRVAVGGKSIERQVWARISRLEGEGQFLAERFQDRPELAGAIQDFYRGRVTAAENDLKTALELEQQLSSQDR